MMRGTLTQTLRSLGISMAGLRQGLQWPQNHGDTDPKPLLGGVSGFSGPSWDGSDLGVMMEMIARDHFDFILPRSYVRSLARRNHNNMDNAPAFVEGGVGK